MTARPKVFTIPAGVPFLDALAAGVLAEHGDPDTLSRIRILLPTRRAVRAWGLDVLCANPAEYSGSLTAVVMPEGHSADRLRKTILEAFDMSLGTGLGRLADKVFRIGHLGHFNDLTLAGTLAGVEMGLGLANVPHQRGGVQTALDFLAAEPAVRASDASLQ